VGDGQNHVIPLTRAILSALQMSLIIKRYPYTLFTFISATRLRYTVEYYVTALLDSNFMLSPMVDELRKSFVISRGYGQKYSGTFSVSQWPTFSAAPCNV